MFETYIVQPIFNMLLMLYASIGDFGVAIIVFTIIIRLALWPFMRKQLHQGRVLRKIQPQIKEIRKKFKGDRQNEAKELQSLYKKHGVNTFASIGILLIQLPLFFGLFSALRSTIDSPERIIRMPYSFVAENETVQEMFNTISIKTNQAALDTDNKDEIPEIISDGATVEDLRSLEKEDLEELYNDTLITVTTSDDGGESKEELVRGPFFEQKLFGTIDLSGRAIGDGGIYLPVLLMAVAAGALQFVQSKRLLSTKSDKESKTIKEIMKEAAESGKEPDQSEISAAMNRRIGYFFAPLITIVAATSPSGLALYFFVGGLINDVQQRLVFKEDVEEMELIADVIEKEEKTQKAKKKTSSKNKKSKNKKKRR